MVCWALGCASKKSRDALPLVFFLSAARLFSRLGSSRRNQLATCKRTACSKDWHDRRPGASAMCPGVQESLQYFAIAAMCHNRGIGVLNTLPWRLKKEMAYFSRITSQAAEGKSNAVVMGRNTWDSIPPKYKPLPGRVNVVVSRTLEKVPDGHHVARSFSDALSLLQPLVDSGKVDKTFVVGGAQLYREALADPRCTRVYLTEIDADFECDVFFPELEPGQFRLVQEEGVPQEEQTEGGLTYRFNVYQRISSGK
ncbi:dihydrofolate reductase [Ixodes scapularis]|uniref:dihydrofolate reductase n=1 Tax=Ixodes scapularis TaxID=6945 RepID=UPI001C38CC7E|nr:dihydrofolate reductase [Ixodes scapularis]